MARGPAGAGPAGCRPPGAGRQFRDFSVKPTCRRGSAQGRGRRRRPGKTRTKISAQTNSGTPARDDQQGTGDRIERHRFQACAAVEAGQGMAGQDQVMPAVAMTRVSSTSPGQSPRIRRPFPAAGIPQGACRATLIFPASKGTGLTSAACSGAEG